MDQVWKGLSNLDPRDPGGFYKKPLLTTAYSKIKKRNLVLINNATYQRETLSERPIRQPLKMDMPISTCIFSLLID